MNISSGSYLDIIKILVAELGGNIFIPDSAFINISLNITSIYDRYDEDKKGYVFTTPNRRKLDSRIINMNEVYNPDTQKPLDEKCLHEFMVGCIKCKGIINV